jgi:hypothetical protein
MVGRPLPSTSSRAALEGRGLRAALALDFQGRRGLRMIGRPFQGAALDFQGAKEKGRSFPALMRQSAV